MATTQKLEREKAAVCRERQREGGGAKDKENIAEREGREVRREGGYTQIARREREREREYIYIYIYIYTDR